MLQIQEKINTISKHILYIAYAITFTLLAFINLLNLTIELKLNTYYIFFFIGILFCILACKYITSPLKICLSLSSLAMTTYAVVHRNFFNQIKNLIYLLCAYIVMYIVYKAYEKKISYKSFSLYNISHLFITLLLTIIVSIVIGIFTYAVVYALTRSLLYIPYDFTTLASSAAIFLILIMIRYIPYDTIKSTLVFSSLGLYVIFIIENSIADFSLAQPSNATTLVPIACRLFSLLYLLVITYHAHNEK